MRLCQVCKRAIEQDRIEGIPDTRLCVEHGREIADYGGEFVMSATTERTSKKGSLKLNYGGIATSRKRNEAAIEALRNDYLLRQA